MTPRALAGCCVPQSHPRPGDNLPSRPVPSLSGSGARPRARPCPPGRRSGSAPGGRTGHTTRPLPLPAWPRLAAFLPCLLSGCSSLPPRFGAARRSAWRCRSRRRDGGGHHRLSPQRCPSFPSPASLFSFTRRERYFCSLSFLPPVPSRFCPKLPAKPRLPGISLWQVGGSHAVPVPGLEAKAARPARGRPWHPQLGEGLRGAEAGVPEQGGPLRGPRLPRLQLLSLLQ